MRHGIIDGTYRVSGNLFRPCATGVRGSSQSGGQGYRRRIPAEVQHPADSGIGEVGGEGNDQQGRVVGTGVAGHVHVGSRRVRGGIELRTVEAQAGCHPETAGIGCPAQLVHQVEDQGRGTHLDAGIHTRIGLPAHGVHGCNGHPYRGGIDHGTGPVVHLHEQVHRTVGHITGPTHGDGHRVGTCNGHGGTGQERGRLRGDGEHIPRIGVRKHKFETERSPIAHLNGVVPDEQHAGGGARQRGEPLHHRRHTGARQGDEHDVPHHRTDEHAIGVILVHLYHEHVFSNGTGGERDLPGKRIDGGAGNRYRTAEPSLVTDRGIRCGESPGADQRIDQILSTGRGDPEVEVEDLTHADVRHAVLGELGRIRAGRQVIAQPGLQIGARRTDHIERGGPAARYPADQPTTGARRQVHQGLVAVQMHTLDRAAVAGAVGQLGGADLAHLHRCGGRHRDGLRTACAGELQRLGQCRRTGAIIEQVQVHLVVVAAQARVGDIAAQHMRGPGLEHPCDDPGPQKQLPEAHRRSSAKGFHCWRAVRRSKLGKCAFPSPSRTLGCQEGSGGACDAGAPFVPRIAIP